jgi:hypothetical protein
VRGVLGLEGGLEGTIPTFVVLGDDGGVDRWRGGLPVCLEGGGLLAANVGSGAAVAVAVKFIFTRGLFRGLGPGCGREEVGVAGCCCEFGVGG